MIISFFVFLIRVLNSIIFLKLDVKSRAAGAGSFDKLGINSDAPEAHKPAAYGLESRMLRIKKYHNYK